MKCWAMIIFILFALPGAVLASKPPADDNVIRIVEQVRRADYEGDRIKLAQLYNQLAPYADDPEIGSRVRYWRGFALWRRALNGFNDSADPKELEQDLTKAMEEFRIAIEKEPGFVDAKAGIFSCLGNLAYLNRENKERMYELVLEASTIGKEAIAAAPNNPRLLWVLGASLWYTPLERGGGQAKAIAAYQKGLEIIQNQKRVRSEPLEPSWGEPELLMNLAWSNLNRSEPDLKAAEAYARAALAIVPYWHYVRDILLRQIRDAKK